MCSRNGLATRIGADTTFGPLLVVTEQEEESKKKASGSGCLVKGK